MTNMKKALAVAAAAISALGLAATLAAQPSTAPEGAKVYIVSPQHGDTVGTNVTVVFGLSNMGVAPAGIAMPNTGHHHLLINKEELPAAGQPMGADVTHFGLGQTQTSVTLEPGQHTLQLVLGDHLHIPHSPPVMSEKITITVE